MFSNSPSATFDLLADGNAFILNSNIPLLVNSGTFRKTAGSGVSTISTLFNNIGTVEVQTGTLAFTGGGTNIGQLTTSASGATLRFGNGTYTLQDASSLTGPGSVSVAGGTVNVLGRCQWQHDQQRRHFEFQHPQHGLYNQFHSQRRHACHEQHCRRARNVFVDCWNHRNCRFAWGARAQWRRGAEWKHKNLK